MWRLIFWVALGASVLPAHAAWRDVYEATVRVERPGAAGSGVVFHADEKFLWVLTNAHVVGRTQVVRVVPFQQGKQLPAVQAVVTLRVLEEWTDAAVLRINRRGWPGQVRVIPLSWQLPQPGQQIITVGCPQADWPSLWHGQVTRVNGRVFYFFPGGLPRWT